MLQALLKKDQAAHTAISVLERMDTLKSYMASLISLPPNPPKASMRWIS